MCACVCVFMLDYVFLSDTDTETLSCVLMSLLCNYQTLHLSRAVLSKALMFCVQIA